MLSHYSTTYVLLGVLILAGFSTSWDGFSDVIEREATGTAWPPLAGTGELTRTHSSAVLNWAVILPLAVLTVSVVRANYGTADEVQRHIHAHSQRH